MAAATGRGDGGGGEAGRGRGTEGGGEGGHPSSGGVGGKLSLWDTGLCKDTRPIVEVPPPLTHATYVATSYVATS